MLVRYSLTLASPTKRAASTHTMIAAWRTSLLLWSSMRLANSMTGESAMLPLSMRWILMRLDKTVNLEWRCLCELSLPFTSDLVRNCTALCTVTCVHPAISTKASQAICWIFPLLSPIRSIRLSRMLSRCATSS